MALYDVINIIIKPNDALIFALLPENLYGIKTNYYLNRRLKTNYILLYTYDDLITANCPFTLLYQFYLDKRSRKNGEFNFINTLSLLNQY